MKNLCPKSSRNGFTLVELLVVIGIIGILISILLPTISRVRSTATRTTCAAQLRDIGNSFQMYLGDSKYRLPGVNPFPLIKNTSYSVTLFDLFDTYQKGNRKVWVCGADKFLNNDDRIAILSMAGNPPNAGDTYAAILGVSYEYNFFLNDIQNGNNFQQALDQGKKRGVTADKFRLFNDLTYFHGKKGTFGNMNFLFADWHVSDLAGSSSAQNKGAGGK